MDKRCENCTQIAKRDLLIERQQSTLSDILKGSRDILYRYNVETNSYDYLSSNIEHITGCTSQEIIDAGINHLLESLHPDDKDAFMEFYHGLINNTIQESELQLEYRTRHKDGRYIKRCDKAKILRNRNGRITAVVGNTWDTTHHRTTEKKLKAAEERYKQLAEATFESILIHEQGTILDVNQQFCETFGYSHEELTGKDCFDLIAPQSHELVRKHITENLEGPYEAFSQKKNGSIFLTEVHAGRIRRDGKDLRIITLRDLTEQKKLRQQLAESEKKYKELYNTAHVALFRTALDGTLTDCNLATLDFFGYSKHEKGFLGNYSVIDAYVDKNRRKQFIELLKKNKRVHNFEVELLQQNGTPFWASVSAELFIEQGYIAGALYNITAQKMLTKTEKKILKHVLHGKTNKEIAHEMNRSIRTIEDHRSHIMRKLGVHNLVELTQKAISMDSPSEK